MAFVQFGNDTATTAQRERDAFLISQIAALAESIRQAQARGDAATVRALQATKNKLMAEHLAIQKAIIAQSEKAQAAAEARPYGAFQGLYDVLTGAGKIAALALVAIAAVVLLPRRR